jgi:hypothetical protein
VEGEYRRRKLNRQRRVREKHPRIGALLLWLRDEPQHQRAFQVGARAERAVGATLDKCAKAGAMKVLHNRRVPGGRGDIDHVVIAQSGVYVIDTKGVSGRVQIAEPLFGAGRLLINGRDRTGYLDGLDRQIAVVRSSVPEGVPIQGILCFTEADLPGLRTAQIRGHLLMYQRALRKLILAGGPLPTAAISGLARQLATALPPA